MRIYIFCFFLLALSGETWAQLTCTNCSYPVTTGTRTRFYRAGSIPQQVLASPGIFNQGSFGLTANSAFAIKGTGYYTINRDIYNDGDGSYGFTLSVPSGGDWGGRNAGLILTGTGTGAAAAERYANMYSGETVIKGGFIACNKPTADPGSGWSPSLMLAIPGDIKLITTTPGLESGLWFGGNNQLSVNSLLTLETSNAAAIVSLNGTTQRLRGIEATRCSGNAILENIEPNNPTNIPGIPQKLSKAVLILTGTSGKYTIGPGAILRAGGWATYNGGLEVQVQGSSQVIRDPGTNIENVTFTTLMAGSRLELNTSSSQVFTIGSSVVFTGDAGIYLKTGPGEIRANNFSPNAANIQVSEGTFTLVGNSKLGGTSYSGSVWIASGAVFEHNNSVRINFRGPILGSGTLRRTGEGVTLISGGRKDLTGNVLVTGNGCFFGGYCDISDASVNVSSNGKIGGGAGEDDAGGNLTVGDLTFESQASKLVVTSMSGTDNTPSLVVVETRWTNNAGNLTLREGKFTVDLVANNLASGYVLKCANGVTSGFPIPTLGINNSGKTPFFKWDDTGLYMSIGVGLTCDNCTVSGITGTAASPAVILSSPGTFSGVITLNGPCNFVITGTGNYTLSGIISGTGPLTYNAPGAGQPGLSTGITLEGPDANTYSGQTTIRSGYIICNKADNQAAVPGAGGIKVSGTSAGNVHLWCRTNNQLGNGVIDFNGASSSSYIHLNGTTQTVAGIQANNASAVVQNNWDNTFLPAGMIADQLSRNPGTLNIAAGSTPYTFKGGSIRKGHDSSPGLTINVTGGTQIIQDPDNQIHDVTLSSQGTATLELNSSDGNTHSFGTGVTFAGVGIIKKTGAGPVTTNNSTIMRSGLIWVSDGVFRNDMTANVYTGNTATLQVDALNGFWDNHSPTFDLWGNNSIFGGLTGGGWVQNNWGISGRDGYNDLTLGQNNNYAVFEGVIRDNSTNGTVSGGDFGTGGIALRKMGTGVQVLKGDNRYTGSTTVSSGTLQLQGNGQLGNATTAGTYNGTLEISNATGGQAIFEHNGDKIQVFTGNITNTGSGSPGLFIQSGTGKTIINGSSTVAKDFTGDVNITAGFLGGSGNLSKSGNLYVGMNGSIGGGYGVDDQGATLTIASLNFLAATSKLIVTSASATDATPSLLDVKNGSGVQGPISAAFRFKVDLLSDNLSSGYLIKCSNGVTGGFLLPTLGVNNTGKTPTFKWDAQGLYMGLGEGLTCDNCTFGNTTGTTANPAVILASPGTFTGNITLNGPCNFSIAGTGDYHLSGIISGTGPLTYNAPNAGQEGHSAGITLDGGATANTYTGLTTLASGYIICNKNDGVAAVPGDIKLSAATATTKSHLWCRTNNQLGSGTTVIDFSDAWSYSYLNLNGTTQTIAGLKANSGIAVVQSNESGYFPAGMSADQLSSSPAVLNIAAAASNTCTFGGGAYIRKGGGNSSSLTVNVTSGSQIIQDPNANINNVTFVTSVNAQGEPATLEFKSTDGNAHTIGSNVTFGGAGILKKTGTALITTNTSNIFKTGGKIWVTEGLFRNENYGNKYANGDSTQIDRATLQVEANASFDMWANVSIFDGLTGGGTVQNNWGPGTDVNVPPGGGYCWLTLGQNNSQGSPTPPAFDGVIKDNPTNGPVSVNGPGAGGIALKKVGSGIQVLRGGNIYTGRTRVSSGTLRLEGNGVLGATTTGDGSYGGVLGISNVSGTAAVFEHKGSKTQVFTGDISNTGSGTLGKYIQSGSGKTIINGTIIKSFNGDVSVTGGFLGGAGDLSKANTVTVEGGGSIGGVYDAAANSAAFIVSNLTFAATASKLIVTSRADNTPSLVDVRNMGTSTTGSGSVTAGNGFTVDVLGGPNLVSGYIMNCTNGVSLPVPTLGDNNTQKTVCFKWDATGLYMTLGSSVVFNQPANRTANSGQAQGAIAFTSTGTGTSAPTGYQWRGRGGDVGLADYTTDWTKTAIPAFTVATIPFALSRFIEVTAINSTTGCTDVKIFTYTVLSPANLTCDNCSFSGPGGATVTGTIANPAIILASPGTFTGNITLKGPCNFSIASTGNYTLSGVISGTGPLTYNAPNAGEQGHSAGITLEGNNPNIYDGLTTLASGYIICNKTNGGAVPGGIKLSATTTATSSHLWCRTNNQLGNAGVLDFRDAQSYSYIHLNGTTQTIAGLQSNNGKAVVENNWDNTFLPAGMTAAQLSSNPAVLNIAAAPNNTNICTFGGGAFIRRGSDTSPALTVNVTSGTQVIQNPNANINNVILTSSDGATLEFNGSDGNSHTIGTGVTFGGAGILKKTGTALITTNTSNIFKTGGKIWVTEGLFRNENYANKYANGDSTQIDRATLQVEANASFDMWADVSIFDALTGGGTVQNNWGAALNLNVPPGGGYCWLTLGQNNSQGSPVFFDGIIKDNPTNGLVSVNGSGAGGIALRKEGTGIQVLRGGNLYTGRTRVSLGTLRLEGNGVLGATTTGDGSYGGVLGISNVSGTAAVFEHRGSKTQIFTGDISNTGSGTFGKYLQSGSGKTIINGTIIKSFNGDVSVTGGFLGGAGDLSKANTVTVEGGGSIGGVYDAAANSAAFIVSNLTFAATASKLRVTSRADNTPSLVDVRTMGTSTTGSGSVIAGNGFTVDVLGGPNLVSGYIMNCTNGASLPVPTLGDNNTQKTVCFKWDATGLYMTLGTSVVFNQPANITANSGQAQGAIAFTSTGTGTSAPTGYQWRGNGGNVGLADYTTDWTQTAIPAFTVATTSITLSRSIVVTAINSTTGCTAVKTFTYTISPSGLTCDNCSFGNATGTIANPAVILASPGTFTGTITLNGRCNFTITGKGNYTLSGQITGTGPLIYNAPDVDTFLGFDTGIILTGTTGNDYTGPTTITGGYLVCNKPTGVAAVPAVSGTVITISSTTSRKCAHLWCQGDNQLGTGAIIDFSGAQYYSFIDLNGTTQTIAGLIANNGFAAVKKNYGPINNRFPVGINNGQVSAEGGTLNIEAGGNRYVFGGGGYIWTGEVMGPVLLTINIKSGTQVIQNPNANINNVILTSSDGATLEFNGSDGNTHTIGTGVTFGGAGIVKKTGTALITTNASNVLKTGGKIWVTEGMFRNENYGNKYANADSTKINMATLQVEANASFDMWANVSIFDGLTGGGTVQNNLGPTPEKNIPPGGGYCWLTLGQNNSQGSLTPPAFDGVIKDNPTNGPVSAIGSGAGGIALRKVGTGTQVLRGGNIYTGRTKVSSGTLRLEGNGVLGATPTGDGSYGGVLGISNVSLGTAAVFEHRGSKTQVFTGDISNTGSGTLGKYIQSGSGKTIIGGTTIKSFNGDVSVTGGFLGGSGNISNANGVTVEGEGSIGGGNGEIAGGAALTVSNLTFAAVTSKLKVTSRNDNTPSFVDVKVKSTTTQGPISVANGFTVEVNGATIVSGYVLKCSNGLTGNLPLPTVVNNTGRTVCFRWDGTGLWMQIGFGNITLISTSLCLAINPVNLVVTVTAAYSDPRDYPSLGAAVDFSLSDPSVKSGNMTITRVQGTTMIATFNGANQTTSDKSYTVTYDDKKNCPVKLDAIIKPQPVLSVSSGGNPACKGTPVVLQATGTGLLTILSANINIATVASITSSVGLATASTTPLGTVNFFATDANGCRSGDLSVSVKDLPVLDVIPNQSVCSGALVDPYIPPSSGVGETQPTHYRWEMKANALNRDIVGLGDYTVDWANSAISRFTAENTTTTILKRDVTVSAYNSATGCLSASQVYTITVTPNPVISFDNAVTSLCSGSLNKMISKTPSTGSGTWLITDAGTTGNSIGTIVTTIANGKGALTAGAVNSDNAVEQDIRYQLGSCVSNALRVSINPKPTVTLSDLTLCGNTQQEAITPGTGTGLRAADGYTWEQSGSDRGEVNLPNSTNWSAVIPSFTPPVTSVVLTRSMSITPRNSLTTCIGDSRTWKIIVNPNPVILFDNAVSSLCSGSLNNLISKGSSTVSGTWSITDAGATGNSIGSIITTNTEGKGNLTAGAVASDNVVEQDIRYQLGTCVSNALRVTINPKPTVTLSDLTLCGNTLQEAITPGTGTGLRAADGYTWEQSGSDRGEVNLSNSTNWSAVIPSFTSPSTSVVLTRSMSITPRNSRTTCIGDSRTWKIIINPNPVILFDNAVSSLCSGSLNNLISKGSSTGSGTWSITDAGATGNSLGSSITTTTEGKGNLTAGAVASDNAVEQDIHYQLGTCVSNALRVSINPKPTVTLSDLTLCGNTPQEAITPGTGTGLRAADGYTWEQSGSDRGEVNLSNSTNWSAVIPSFTPPGTSVVLTRSMSITPRNSRTTCIGDSRTWKIIINPNPVILFDNAVTSLCSGSLNNLISKGSSTGSGTWSITDAGATGNSIGSSITTTTEGKGNLTAGAVASDNAVEQDIHYQLGNCVSNALRVTINPKPTVTLPDLTLCGNTQQEAITPGTGTGLRAADGYTWEQSGSDRGEVNLSNSTNWSAVIPSFTPPVTVVVLTRSMSITPRNSRTTCIGDSRTWKIIINPNPVILFDNAVTSLCSGSLNNLISKGSSTGSGTWSITDAGTTGNSIGSSITTTTEGKGNLTAGAVASDNAVEQDIRYQLGTCVSNALRVSINPKPTVTLSDLTLCGNTQQEAITPGTGTGLRAADGYTWEQSGSDRGEVNLSNSTNWSAVIPSFTPPVTVVVLTRSMSITPRNSRTTCIGDSRTWKIIINPNPVILFDNAVSSLCSGSLNNLISKGSSTGSGGTWSITDAGTTGNSIGSSITTTTEGKGNLTAGAVASDNAVEQDIRYQLGTCVSNALRVSINPKPTVTLSDLTLCGNTLQEAITPGTGTGLRAADGYTWEQSGSDRGEVNLSNSTNWSAVIPSFTPPVTVVVLTRSMSITPRNSRTTCIGDTHTWNITINPNPVILFDNAVTSLCSGSLNNLISKGSSTGSGGTWSITDAGTTGNSIGSSITTNTEGKGNLTAGAVASDNAVEQDIHYQLGTCVSNALRVTINPKPTVTLPDLILCGNTPQEAITPGTGTGLRAADGYTWEQSGSDRGEVNLSNSTNWSAVIPSFTPPVTVVVLTRSMSITPRNSRTTCIGDTHTWNIIVSPNPVIRVDNILVSRLCSGSIIDNLITKTPLTGSGTWSITDAGTTDNTIGSSITTNTEGKGNLTAGTVNSDKAREQVIRYQLGTCISNALQVSINPKPTVSLSDVTLCGNTRQDVITPGTGTGLRAADGYKWEQSGSDRGEVNLSNSSTSEWSATIPSFTPPVTAVGLIRGMSIRAYNSTTHCIGDPRIWKITVNPNPVIAANAIDVSKLCSGLNYTHALVCGEGTRAVYKTGTEEAGLSTVANSTSGYANLQAPNVTGKTVEDIVLTFPTTSCKNKLTITIYPKPVMNEIPDLVTCGNAPVAAYTPASTGLGEAKPTHYKWKVAADAVNSANVGLADTDNWTEAISQFTAVNPVNSTAVLKRDVTVYAYNATSGCQAASQVYTITVNSGLRLTYTATSPICNGIETDVLLRSTLSPTTYTWTVANNSAGARSQTTASNTSFIRQTLTNRGSRPETVKYKVTATSGSCSDTVSVAIKVSNTDPATPTVTGGGHYCANIENGTYQTDLKPSVPGKNVEWTYTTYYGNDQAAGSLTGNTQKTEQGTLTAVKDNLVLSNTSSASVYYVFRPFSAGCFGTPSDPIGIRLYAAPVIAAILPQEICSSSEAYPTATNIALSTSTPDVVYTWTVDKINGRDVSGYSEPSSEGARVPTQNPAEARSSPIADVLSLPANADTQTLNYSITPWHLGCPGKAVLGSVKVNPLPTVTAPVDREHCLGDAALRVDAEPLRGTATAFSWTGGANAGLANQTVYGPGLPAYRVAVTTVSIAAKVTISGKNDKGCIGSTSFNITVNPKPSITLKDVQNICAGSEIATAAQTNIKVSSSVTGTKYTWRTSFVDFRPDGKSNVKMVNGNNELVALPVQESPKEEGNFIKKITATTGSDAQITFRLTPFLGSCMGTTVPAAVRVNGVNLGADIANNSPYVCSGGTTNIKVGKEGDGTAYSWERINNSNNVLAFTPKELNGATTISDVLTLTSNKRDSIIYRITPKRRFTPRNSGEYYCSGRTVSSVVFVNPIPVLSLSPTTASICSGQKTAITPSLNLMPPESNEVYYTWEVTPNTLGAQSSSGSQASIPPQVLTNDNALESSVTYTITPQYQPAAGGTCKGQAVTSVYKVNAGAKASISSVPEAVCLGDKVTLKTDSKDPQSQWLKNGKVIPGAIGDSYVVSTDSVSVSSYTIRTTTAACGSGTSEARIVKVSADAYFTGGSVAMDKTVAVMGEAVKFSYTGPQVNYLWDFNDNTPISNTESVTHSYIKLGTYYPTLKATKPGQAACTKTFSLSFLEIRSVNSTSSTGYGVFPIPARDKLTITNEDDLQNITLSDMSGKMVLNEVVKGRSVTLSVAHVAPGIYLLTITDIKGGVKRLEVSKE